MMYVVQSAIILACIYGGIYWRWPGTGWSHFVFGLCLAYGLTILVDWIGKLFRWLTARRRQRQFQRSHSVFGDEDPLEIGPQPIEPRLFSGRSLRLPPR